MATDKNYMALQRYSREHFDAYLLLKLNTKSQMTLLYIKYYLLCRSLELAFKSLLIFYSVTTIDEVKSKYRHNLDKILKDIVGLPTVVLNEQEIEIIKTLNLYYNDKQFEYPKTGLKTFPLLTDVENLCNRFILVS